MKKTICIVWILTIIWCPTVFAQLSIQATTNIVCQGSSATLYAVGASSGISWQPGGSTAQFITVSPTGTTTYVLTSGTSTINYTVQVCEDADCQTNNVVTFQPLLLSTGNNGLTSVLSAGQNDANWMYTTTLNGTYVPAVVSDNTLIPPNYSKSSWPNAQWIGPNEDLFTISSTYYYRLQITLTAEQASTLSLNMQFMADNTVVGVSVNNVLIPNSNTPGNNSIGFQSQNASSVTMQGSWVAGLNTITVQVLDLGGYSAFLAQLNPVLTIPTQTIVCTTLPIKFLSLEGNVLSDGIKLTWNAAMDHISQFIIEESEDGTEFNTIGQIEIPYTQNNIVATYNFTDFQAQNGINYYRIGAYENDGTISYSSICAMKKDGVYDFSVFPNPSKGIFTVSGTLPYSENNYLHVFNVVGQLVYTQILNKEEIVFNTPIDLSYLPKGVYIARLDNVSSIKIIIE